MAEDITIEDLVELSERAGQGDLAVAMRDIHEAVEENWPDDAAVSEATEQVVLPFHDEDREAAFTLGITYGAWLEQEFPEDEKDDGDDEATEASATVEQSQEQSVTVEA
jgi:hypothetical protein